MEAKSDLPQFSFNVTPPSPNQIRKEATPGRTTPKGLPVSPLALEATTTTEGLRRPFQSLTPDEPGHYSSLPSVSRTPLSASDMELYRPDSQLLEELDDYPEETNSLSFRAIDRLSTTRKAVRRTKSHLSDNKQMARKAGTDEVFMFKTGARPMLSQKRLAQTFKDESLSALAAHVLKPLLSGLYARATETVDYPGSDSTPRNQEIWRRCVMINCMTKTALQFFPYIPHEARQLKSMTTVMRYSPVTPFENIAHNCRTLLMDAGSLLNKLTMVDQEEKDGKVVDYGSGSQLQLAGFITDQTADLLQNNLKVVCQDEKYKPVVANIREFREMVNRFKDSRTQAIKSQFCCDQFNKMLERIFDWAKALETAEHYTALQPKVAAATRLFTAAGKIPDYTTVPEDITRIIMHLFTAIEQGTPCEEALSRFEALTDSIAATDQDIQRKVSLLHAGRDRKIQLLSPQMKRRAITITSEAREKEEARIAGVEKQIKEARQGCAEGISCLKASKPVTDWSASLKAFHKELIPETEATARAQ